MKKILFMISFLLVLVGCTDQKIECGIGSYEQDNICVVKTFSLKIYPNNEQQMNEQILNYGDEVVLDEPVKEGYQFIGWYTDEELTSEYISITSITSDVTVYAKWELDEPDKFNVIIHTNSDQQMDNQLLEYGDVVVLEDPVKDGYYFMGWYTDEELSTEYTPIDSITSDVTVYAKWESEYVHDINALVDEESFNGTLLVHAYGEDIVISGYGYADANSEILNDVDTRFRIGSLTKQFTAVAILMLEEQGLLSVEDTIDQYIDDFPNSSTITIHHLLTHTAGLGDYFNAILQNDAINRDYHSAESLIDTIRYDPLLFNPGESFHYSNAGYLLLGYIIEQVSGMSYIDFMEENIFTPLNMTDTGYYGMIYKPSDAKGYIYLTSTFNQLSKTVHPSIPFAAGGLSSTVIDLYKWHIGLKNHILLSEESTNKLYGKYVILDGAWYGYGIYVLNEGDIPIVVHQGSIQGFKSSLYCDLENDVVIAVLMNVHDADKLFKMQTELINMFEDNE